MTGPNPLTANFGKRERRKGHVRPSIDLTPVQREWRTIPAAQIAPGDTVPGVGLVHKVYLPGAQVHVTGGAYGELFIFRLTDQVKAFVLHE